MFCQLRRLLLIALISLTTASYVAISRANDPGDEYWSSDYYNAGVGGYISTMLSQPGSVYVGGSFSAITNVSAVNVARLDMTAGVIDQVVPLGSGLDKMVKAICEHNGDIIAVGNFDKSGTTTLNHVARWDGLNWQSLGTGLAGIWPQSAVSFQGQLYVDNYRWNGSNWEEIFANDGNVTTATVYDGLLYVGGSFTTVQEMPHQHVFAWDGTEVLSVGTGFEHPVYYADASASSIVFSGYSDFGMGQVSSWNGTSWTIELDNTIVREVAFHDDDLIVSATIYLGGSMFTPRLLSNSGGSWHGIGEFDTGVILEHEGLLLAKVNAGVEPGVLSPGLIGYTGTNFQSVFEPANGFSGTFASVDALGNTAIVGGSFNIANGEEFDGSAMTASGQWHRWGNRSDLDTSFPGAFVDLEVVGSEVFGVYSYTDYDVEVQILTKLVWTGSNWQWQYLDTGTWFYGNLQRVGTELFNIGYGGVNRVDLQSGITTQVPGTDLNGSVYGSCNYLGTITICGSFTTNNDLPVSNVLRYMNNSWQNVGDTLPGYRVTAITPMDGVNLAASTWVDGVWRVSIFDGAGWSTLPGDFDGSITNLVFHRGRLFAAGSFDNVSLTPSPGISIWTGDRWATVGSGLSGRSYSRVSDMVTIGEDLFLTGAFNHTGGQPSVGFAKWTGDPTLFNGLTTAVQDPIQPSARLLGDVYPNPFNPSTRVAFEVPKSGHIQIGIFDLRGNRVRDLVNENYAAGSYCKTWNGLDDSGKALPSGMYFARMLTGDKVESVKLTLVR